MTADTKQNLGVVWYFGEDTKERIAAPGAPLSSEPDPADPCSLPWIWIGGGVLVGVVGALAWERARHDSSTATRCC